MADSILDNRRRIRPRVDETVLHKSNTVDGTTTTDIVRLDVVVSKVSVSVPSTLTADIYGSIDGANFYILDSGVTGTITSYGDKAGEHLVKLVKVVRTAGTGAVIIAGCEKGMFSTANFNVRKTLIDRILISDSNAKNVTPIIALTDAIAITDSILVNLPATALVDSIAIQDTVQGIFKILTQNISDNLSISDTVTVTVA